MENVSQSTESMGFHARQAYLDDGRRVVAWAEVDPDDFADMDIFAAERSDASWSAEPLTDDDEQNTYTDLVSDGEKLYLVWSGRKTADADHDIFLSIQSGGTWSAPTDLTSAYESGELRRDYRPRAALSPEGDLVVAYLSNPVTDGGVLNGPEDVRVQEVTGADAGKPETVIPSGDTVCSEVALASTPNGDSHLIAGCGLTLRYATNAGGAWSASRELDREGTGDGLSPAIAADDRGVHIVYRADVPCGDSSCGEIFYLRGTSGGVFERSIPVSSTPDAIDIFPTIAIDRWGRILVAYTERGEEDDTAYFSYSESGEAFVQPIDISPGDVVTRDQPADIALHPETGLPTVAFLRTFSGSDPLNIDVFTADFTADFPP